MAKEVTNVRRNELIQELGVQIRADEPSLPQDLIDGSSWWNSSQNAFKARINGVTKTFAFVGDTAGEVLYSTTVSTAQELQDTISAGSADTIFLRAGAAYNLTTVSSPGLVIQKPIRLIGEKTRGADGTKVKIITDSTHIVSAAPASATVTSNNTVTVTNGSTSVTLQGGSWATDLTGQYLFVDGIPYKISANPNPTTLTLERAFTGITSAGKTYFVCFLLDGVSFENIEFAAQTSTHYAVVFQNVYRPVLTNCTLTATDSIIGKVKYTFTYESVFAYNDLLNYKVDYLSDNYNGLVVENNFLTSTLMGTDASVIIDTQKGTSSVNTFFTVGGNKHTGPGAFLKTVSANANLITDNQSNSASTLWINIDSNSHTNTITQNRSRAVTGGDVLIRVNSSGNIVNSNRLIKTTGVALDLTATATRNTVVGNLVDGGATINDTVTANLNRIEDDLVRFGQAASGQDKDVIDKINSILATLQNVPEDLIIQHAAVNSGVVTESPVFWNNFVNEYQTADASSSSKDALIGIAKKTALTSGDIHIGGLVELTNSGNVLLTDLFNSGYIGQNFYVGVSGQLVAESQLLTSSSGVPTNPLLIGRLIDIVGGAIAQLNITTREDQKYGTSQHNWYFGQNDATEKSLTARSVAGDTARITYSHSAQKWYSVNGTNSGEIVQPLNSMLMANSVFDYDSGILVSVTSSTATVSPHSYYVGGYKKRTGTATIASALGSFSGNVFLFDHPVSGTLISSGYIANAAFLGAVYNSGSVFATDTLAPAYMDGANQRVVNGGIVPVTSGYVELASVFVPYASGTIDVMVSASVMGSVLLQALQPYQAARIKLQLNGADISGTERIQSFSYVSGTTLYSGLSVDRIVTAYSTIGTVHQITLMGAYDLPASTAPVTFSGVTLIVRGL